MKNLFLTITILFFFCYAGAQVPVTYTPMSAGGYSFKYLRADSGFNVPFQDTALRRGTTRPGAIVCNPSDSLLYYFDGLYWVFIGGTSGGGGGTPTTIYVRDDLTVDTTTNPGYQTLGRLHDDGLVWGGIVTGAGGMDVDITPAYYYLNHVPYLTVQTTLTIGASHATLNRQDLIIVDTFGVVSVLAGTPAANPSVPQINPGSQIALTSIYIPAGATSLLINTDMVYDENIEWTTGSTGTISVDFDNTDNPHTGVKAAFINTFDHAASITFTDSGLDTVSAGEILKFFIYLNGFFSSSLQAQFFNGTTPVSSRQSLVVNFGFNPYDSNNYQNISIPLSTFTFYNTVFNKIVIYPSGQDLSGSKGFYLDGVQLQKGLTPQGKSYVDSITVIAGSDYYWKNGQATLIGARSTGGGSGGLSAIFAGWGLTNVDDSTLKADSTLLLTKLGAAALYQPILTAGTNITIVGNTINSTAGGTVQSVTGIAPIIVNNTDPINPVVSIPLATTVTDGYLSSADHVRYDSAVVKITNPSTSLVVFRHLNGVLDTLSITPVAIFNATDSGLVPHSNGTARQTLHGDGVWRDTTAVSGSSGWNLTGNAATTTASNFLGTTDAIGLKIKTNNAVAIQIDSSTIPRTLIDGMYIGKGIGSARHANVGIGDIVLNANTTGRDNVAIGDSTMYLNTTGNENTVIGANALRANVIGHDNTAVGYGSLFASLGDKNTAFGSQALKNATSGTFNIAIGFQAVGAGVTTGSNNIAMGFGALNALTSGTSNIGIGLSALAALTSGTNNVMVGNNAGVTMGLTAVGSNVGIGYGSMQFSTTAHSNTAVGMQSMLFNTTGLRNVALGKLAGAAKLNAALNDKLYIANDTLATSNLIVGDFSTGQVQINAAKVPVLNVSAAFEIISTTKGLLLPRMTKTQRDAISTPIAGLVVYQTDNTPGIRVYNGTNWMRFTETAD